MLWMTAGHMTAGAPADLVQIVTGYAEAGNALVTGGVDKVKGQLHSPVAPVAERGSLVVNPILLCHLTMSMAWRETWGEYFHT